MYENRAYEMDIRRDRISAWKEGFKEGMNSRLVERAQSMYDAAQKKFSES